MGHLQPLDYHLNDMGKHILMLYKHVYHYKSYRIAQNFGGGKLWRISAQSIYGRENIGGLVILSALEIDPVYVLLGCFSKTPCLFRFTFNVV